MILRNLSFLWAMFHTFLFFLFLFRSRISPRKTLAISAAVMLPLLALNLVLVFLLDNTVYPLVAIFTLALPSLITFVILSENRDRRFFFTLCIADTLCLEVVYLTQILNHYISPASNLFMLLSRLIIFPVLEVLEVKYLRPTYLEVQRANRQGLGHFSLIGVLIFGTLVLLVNYPTPITDRPAYYPLLALLFILTPLVYLDIVYTLKQQITMAEMTQQENILRLQSNHIVARMEELATANDRFREERHNYRHKMKTIASLIDRRQYEELRELVSDYADSIQRTRIVRYCDNPILDAVLSTYIHQAHERGIRTELGFAFPNPLPVNATELATVLANAIENAIHACEALPPEERYLEIKVLSEPRFMAMVKNPYQGTVEFDKDGIPVSRADGHGFGTRSIVAFCDLNHAYWHFVAKDGEFTLSLNF